MDESRINTWQVREAQLIDRAMKDEAFRQELLGDPKGVFARELGIRLPEHVTVEVLEETPTTVYLVLPRLLDSPGVDLADEELEGVAGGASASDVSCYLTCDPHFPC